MSEAIVIRHFVLLLSLLENPTSKLSCDALETELNKYWLATDTAEWPRVMRRPIPAALFENWKTAAHRCIDMRFKALDPNDPHSGPRNALLNSVLLQDDEQRRAINAWVPVMIMRSMFTD